MQIIKIIYFDMEIHKKDYCYIKKTNMVGMT